MHMRIRGVVKSVLILVLFSLMITGCISKDVSFISSDYQTHKPFNGKIKVYWKQHTTLNVNNYTYIGRVSGKATLCGSTPAIMDQPLHKRLIHEASKQGGNAVILSCGGLGSVGQCDCSGEVIILNDK